ncbi:hypothetical protein FOA52_013419 [Chlamydomonas sp. UWO 241]|nr:hypothetical protein FOA52_013419 [Chlamydomonas sp. UWO 241]
MADVAKRLAFEDLSLTLSSLVHTDEAHLKAQLIELLSECEKHSRGAEDRAGAARDQATKQTQAHAGRTLLKRQLQSLKSSMQNLGQKASFSEAILSFSDAHDYKAEAERTAAALESAEEDLKDLKKANHQDEGDLCEAIRVVEARQEQLQASLARLDQRLEVCAHDLSSLGTDKLPPDATQLPEGVTEEGLEEAVAEAQQEAQRLEAELARTEASCQDLEGDLVAHDTEMARMQAETTRQRAVQLDESRAIDDRHAAAASWCDTLSAIATQLTGTSVEHIGEDELRVRLMGPAEGQEHVVHARLASGGADLASATVSPADGVPSAEGLVGFARESGGGLPLLLNLVRVVQAQRQAQQ